MGWSGTFTDGLFLPAAPAITGRWAGPSAIPNATHSMGAGNMRVVPITLPACSLDRIGCEITTAVASSLVRLGIYEDDGGKPGVLTVDAGTLDSSTTGLKELTVGVDLVAGDYWLALMVDTASGAVSYRGFSDRNQQTRVTSQTLNTLMLGANTLLYQSLSAGALPSPAPSTIGAAGGGGPMIGVRFA